MEISYHRGNFLDQDLGLARTKTTDERKQTLIVGVCDSVVDINAHSIRDVD
jgi:hypothetical protein